MGREAPYSQALLWREPQQGQATVSAPRDITVAPKSSRTGQTDSTWTQSHLDVKRRRTGTAGARTAGKRPRAPPMWSVPSRSPRPGGAIGLTDAQVKVHVGHALGPHAISRRSCSQDGRLRPQINGEEERTPGFEADGPNAVCASRCFHSMTF